MLESAEHAHAQARPGPRAPRPGEPRCPWRAGAVAAPGAAELGARRDRRPDAVISGATGVAPITAEETETLGRLAPEARIHPLGDLIGHGLEVAAPFGAALAAALIAEGRAGDIAVTTVGHRRGEGVMRLTRA